MAKELNNASSPLSPVGAKIFGADAAGNAGWFDPELSRNGLVPEKIITFESTTGLTLTGTDAAFSIDPTYCVDGPASLKVVTGSGSFAEIAMNPCGIVSNDGTFRIRVYIPDWTKVSGVILTLATDAAFANKIEFKYMIGSFGNLKYNGWHEARFGVNTGSANSEIVASGTPFALNGSVISAMKIRISPVSGQVATAYIDSLQYGGKNPAYIVVNADDGYKSWYDLGIPYLNARGIKASHYLSYAVIGTGTGDNQFMTEAEVANLYEAGHDLCAHGSASLATLATPADRYADIKASVDWLESRGFTRGARHYAWPSGVYEMSAGDRSLINSAISAGILTARSTNVNRFIGGVGFHANVTRRPLRRDTTLISGNLMAMPIIGVDGTKDVGVKLSETTARIDKLVAEGGVGILMFHKIGSSPVDFNHCPEADFQAIIDQVHGYTQAGTVQCLTITEMYNRLIAGPQIEPFTA